MDEEQILELLRSRLSVRVDKTSEYNGGCCQGSMYTEYVTIQLLLNDQVISEATI